MRALLLPAGLCAVILLTSAAQPAKKPWTIAIYLDADNNLDRSAMDDLDEMARAGYLKNVNIVYQIDRNDDEAESGVERGVILNGKRTTVKTLPELNSDDPKNVADFISWAYTKYPSQRKALIMWDHGDGWDGGFGGDEHGPGLSSKKTGILSIEDFAGALKKSLRGRKLDILSFDACLMGGAELMAQFAPYAHTYIANPEIDYGDGWNYSPTFQFINTHPNAPLSAIAEAEVSLWKEQHDYQPDDKNYGVHAAYNLDRWQAAQSAINSFATFLSTLQKNPSNNGALWRARAESIQYDYASYFNSSGLTRDYIDLGHYAKKLASFLPKNAALQTKVSRLNRSLSAVVTAKTLGYKRKEASAVSIYFPTHIDSIPSASLAKRYTKISFNKSKKWSNFLGSWTQKVASDTTPPKLKNVKLSKFHTKDTFKFSFTIEGADTYAAAANLYQKLGNGNYLDYGDIYYTRLSSEYYEFEWKTLTWSIHDKQNTSFVTADYSNPDDNLMSAYALYTPPSGDSFDVLVQFTESGKVFGILDNSGESPTGINVEKGGSLRFYLRTYNSKSGDGWKLQDQKIQITNPDLNNIEAELTELPAGNFQISFAALDYTGNSSNDYVDIKLK